MSYYTGLGAFAQGVAQGLKENKQEAKETEQREYERNWNQTGRDFDFSLKKAAEQRAQGDYDTQQKISAQQFEQNKFTLGGMERKETEEVLTQKRHGFLSNISPMFDLDDKQGVQTAFNDYQKANNSSSSKHNLLALDEDGTYSVNSYDPNDPTKFTNLKKGVTLDDIRNTVSSMVDPDGAWKAKQSAVAEAAKAKRELAVDDYKWGRNFQGDITKLGITNRNAWDLAEYNQQQANGREQMKQDGANYRNASPSSVGKAGALTPVFGDLSSLTANDMLPYIVGRETNGVHYSANGGLITSPAGAQGITQVMPKTGVNPGYGVVPLRNTSADEYKRFGHDYYDAMLKEFGGDHTKALAAYNAGPGAVQNAVAAAQKNGGNWLNNLPVETQKYVPGIVSKVQASRNAAQLATTIDRARQTTANAIGSNIAPVAKRVSEMFAKDTESGITPPKVNGALQQASQYLTKAATSNDPNEKRALYNQAGDVLSMLIANSNLSVPEKSGLRDQMIVELTGSSSLAQVGNGMGFNQPPQDTRTQQRAHTKTVPSTFSTQDEALYNQVMGITPPAQSKSVGKANLASTRPKTEAQQIVEKAQTSIAANKNRQYTGLNTTKLNQLQKQKADLSNKLAVFDRQTAQLQATVNELEQSVKNNPELARGVNLWGRKSEIDTRKKQRAALARQAGDVAEQFDELQRQANRPQPTSGIGVATMKRG
jgi:hypothetical protein